MSDPEIDAMSTISGALDKLEEPARDRVLRWARDRYGTTKAASPAPSTIAGSRSEMLPREQVRQSLTDVADVYATANPSSDGEKVLVVGYWFQAVRGDSELDSQTINTELKNLGYPVGNVTRAVTSLATSIPRLVVQTKKSGSTKQARKKFRLTVEGIKRVEQMLGGAIPRPTRTGADSDAFDEADE